MMETGSRLAHFWKKDRESLSRLSVNEFKLATNNMLGYDMPRVKLKIYVLLVFVLIPGGEIERE